MTYTEPRSCALCGNTDHRELRTRLVHWKDALPGMQYSHITACSDYAACRSRVEASDEEWPVVESSERKSA